MLSDNYSYLVVDRATREALLVDPVEAGKALAAADDAGAVVKAILCTHHHWDHSGGNAEIVVDGETGYVVPKGDADALAAALRRYLQDPAEAVAHGEAGFARSMQMFTDEHLGPEVEAVVRGLLTPAVAEA